MYAPILIIAPSQMRLHPALSLALCLLIISGSCQCVDNEYCSLNLEKNECLSQTTNKDCCWLTFTHKNGYGKDIDGCFDYRFIVNSLKFVTNPKAFDTMSDSDICTKLGYQCSSVTQSNFLDFFSKAPSKPETLITSIQFKQCHN